MSPQNVFYEAVSYLSEKTGVIGFALARRERFTRRAAMMHGPFVTVILAHQIIGEFLHHESEASE